MEEDIPFIVKGLSLRRSRDNLHHVTERRQEGPEKKGSLWEHMEFLLMASIFLVKEEQGH